MRTRQETVPRRYSRMGIGGDGSTLNLDFTAMSSLDSRFTFSRASTVATYVNSSGYIATATTNEPRFDYNPTTLAAKGLLIEGQAINIALYSQSINSSLSYLVGNGTTLTQNTTDVLDPANGNTATKIALTASTYCSRAQIVAVSGSTQYTFSYYLRGTAGNQCRIYSYAGFTGDLVTQTNHTYTTNSWTRVTTTFTTNAATTGIYIYVCSRTSAASPAEVIYVWGAQLEIGTGASSYIPTVASQVTRATDVCYIDGTNFSSWFNNTEGTVLFIGNNTIVPAPSNFSANWALINAAGSSRITQYTRHTTGRIGASCRDSGGGALTFDSPSATTLILTTAEYKTAFALKSSDFAYSVNGAAVGLGDGVGVFETVASLEFARDGIRNGHVKCFKFWPARLTNAQLIAITT